MPDDLPPTVAVRLEVERLNLLYVQNVSGMIALSANVLCYSLVASAHVSRSFLVAWAVLVLVGGLARLIGTFFWWRRRSRIRHLEETRPWLLFMQVLLFASGCGWGAIGWVTGLSTEPILQIFTAMALMFMAAGAIATYSASVTAMYCVLLPAMIPWVLRFFVSSQPEWMLLGGLGLVYVFLGIGVARNLNSYVERSMRLHVENEELNSVLEKQILIKEEARQAFRESEARLRFALESSDATTWTWDLSSDTFVFEGHLSATLGIEAERFEGRSDQYLAFVHPQDRPELLSRMDAAASGRGELDSEHRVIWPDGGEHFLILRGRVQAGHNGSPARLIGVCWNVTDRRNEETLRRQRDISDVANKAKSVFLANASHEIRTPLAAINGFSEILTQDPSLPESSRADVEVILRNGRYLVALVNDLLDLSKIETGRLYIQKNSLSPSHEIGDSVLVVQDEMNRKGLSFELVYDTPVPEKIESDGNRFRQILINLLENAVKFTERGGISVHVSFAPQTDGGLLKIRVRDTGIGLGAGVREHLFQPFARGPSAEVQRVQGSGLGLALSRDLSRLLGGDLHLVDSVPGRGSEFEFSVATGPIRGPLVTKADVHRAAPGLGHEALGPERRLQGRRLLVVDDVPDLREVMTRAFEAQGATVETAANGIEALNLALTRPFDAVLLDVKMPVMDGYEVATILRGRRYSKPVIALTAHASNEDRQRCLAAGFDDYVSKPVDLDHIVDLVLGHVGREPAPSPEPVL